MSLSTPESVQKLQMALHDKAKEAPNFRFYALYDKVYRKDVLAFAYQCCKANGGAAGVDGQTFEDIEAYGEERWLDELAQELKKRTYQRLPVPSSSLMTSNSRQRPSDIRAIVADPRYPIFGSGNGIKLGARTINRSRPGLGTVRQPIGPQRTSGPKTRRKT